MKPTQYISDLYIKYGLLPPLPAGPARLASAARRNIEKYLRPLRLVRDAYLARRAYLVSDGKATEDSLVEPEPDPAEPTTAPPPPPPK